jgi:hypothetical protein
MEGKIIARAFVVAARELDEGRALNDERRVRFFERACMTLFLRRGARRRLQDGMIYKS